MSFYSEEKRSRTREDHGKAKVIHFQLAGTDKDFEIFIFQGKNVKISGYYLSRQNCSLHLFILGSCKEDSACGFYIHQV